MLHGVIQSPTHATLYRKYSFLHGQTDVETTELYKSLFVWKIVSTQIILYYYIILYYITLLYAVAQIRLTLFDTRYFTQQENGDKKAVVLCIKQGIYYLFITFGREGLEGGLLRL